MAAKDLITLARAKQNIQSITDTSQDSLLTTLITAASDAIVSYCKRDFISKSYDELYSGGGQARLMLREYPLVSVESVRYRAVTVLKIQNTATTANQQARVSVTSTGLKLVRVASGVTSTDTSVTWAGNATLQAVGNAVNALGNGWSAQVVGDAAGDYGLWPAADLYAAPSFGAGTFNQGALTARGQFAELKMHTTELAGYQWDARGWLLRAIPYTDPELLHPEDLVFPEGINNFRVQYTAGYATIPEAVQEACAEWVAFLYYKTLRDPMLKSQLISGATSQVWENPGPQAGPPADLAAMLAPYRRCSIASQQS